MKAQQLQRKRPERDIQKSIEDYLTAMQIPYSITDAARVWGKGGKLMRTKVKKGWPDITAVLPRGKAFFIECKKCNRESQARTVGCA